MYLFKKSVITRLTAPDEREPYLIRWTIFGCRWFTIKIHKILQTDDACLHDHPWSFLSLILWGGYFEEQYTSVHSANLLRGMTERYGLYLLGHRPPTIKKWFGPGRILWRPHGVAHRLELPGYTEYKSDYYGQPSVNREVVKTCLTLVITFRRRSEWGFFTPERWVANYMYDQSNLCE